MKTKFIRTRNYEQFKLFTENRPVKKAHVKNLMLSIQQHGLLEEITVNEHSEIIDGQHRFFALKNLDLPILAKVKVGATIDTVLPTNLVRKGWAIENFIHYYAEKGNTDYQTVQRIIAQSSGLSITTVLEVYSKNDRSKVSEAVKSGKYEVDVALGNYLITLLKEMEEVVFKDAYVQKFVRPFIRMVKKNKNFSVKRFKKRSQKYKINVFQNEADTYRSMVEFYNKGLSEKNRIY